MRINRLALFAAAALGVAAQGTAYAQATPCFTPLSDPAARKPSDYNKLLALKLPEKAEGVIEFQPLKTGWFTSNIDYYYVVFTAPKNITQKQFFKSIRLKYPDFARGILGKYAFGPYESSEAADDAVRRVNMEKWQNDNPVGALMTFNLGTLWPSTDRRAGSVSFHEKAGDVQVICASDTDFVFSTVRTKAAGWHPVSGFRGFGLMTDKNNPERWIFYSMAADRNSLAIQNSVTWVPYVDSLFCKGHIFWTGFFSEFRTFLYEQRLKVNFWSLKNHGPVPYPLTDEGEPYKRLDCGTQTEPTPEKPL